MFTHICIQAVNFGVQIKDIINIFKKHKLAWHLPYILNLDSCSIRLIPASDPGCSIRLIPASDPGCSIRLIPASDSGCSIRLIPASDSGCSIRLIPASDSGCSIRLIPASDPGCSIRLIPASDPGCFIRLIPRLDPAGHLCSPFLGPGSNYICFLPGQLNYEAAQACKVSNPFLPIPQEIVNAWSDLQRSSFYQLLFPDAAQH